MKASIRRRSIKRRVVRHSYKHRDRRSISKRPRIKRRGGGICEDTYKIKIRNRSKNKRTNVFRNIMYIICKYVAARKLHQQYFPPKAPIAAVPSLHTSTIPGVSVHSRGKTFSTITSNSTNKAAHFAYRNYDPSRENFAHRASPKVNTKPIISDGRLSAGSIFTAQEIHHMKDRLLPDRPKNAVITIGDGNCMFNAVSMQLYSREFGKLPTSAHVRQAARALRKAVVGDVLANRSRNPTILDRDVQYLATDGSHAGAPEITATANYLGTPIEVYAKRPLSGRSTLNGRYGGMVSNVAPITLYYDESAGHFEVIDINK